MCSCACACETIASSNSLWCWNLHQIYTKYILHNIYKGKSKLIAIQCAVAITLWFVLFLFRLEWNSNVQQHCIGIFSRRTMCNCIYIAFEAHKNVRMSACARVWWFYSRCCFGNVKATPWNAHAGTDIEIDKSA